MHIANMLKEKELYKNSVVKEFLTTAADGKNYNVVFYSLEMIIAVGYRVRGVRRVSGTSPLSSNLRNDYNTALEQKKSLEFQDRLKNIFG